MQNSTERNFKSLPPDLIEGLKQFATTYGRNWKSQLLDFWSRGVEIGDYRLRLVRNSVGPSGLLKITTKQLFELDKTIKTQD